MRKKPAFLALAAFGLSFFAKAAQQWQAWQARSNAHQQRMAQQNADSSQHSQFINHLRDETNVYNPSAGQSYKVESGDGTIVGTPGYAGNPYATEYSPLEKGYHE